eukprot:146599-Pyramimonas_sp.AAC.1
MAEGEREYTRSRHQSQKGVNREASRALAPEEHRTRRNTPATMVHGGWNTTEHARDRGTWRASGRADILSPLLRLVPATGIFSHPKLQMLMLKGAAR